MRSPRSSWSTRTHCSPPASPGAGPVLTAVLLAKIGEDRARFSQPEVLLAEAGLASVTRSSGRSRSVRFRYAANSRLREATMLWAFITIKMSSWAAAAFRDAREQKSSATTAHSAGCLKRRVVSAALEF